MLYGQSINIEKRLKCHNDHLIINKHGNIHLQRSFNKYGDDNFEFEILEECKIEELDDLEQYYIFLANSIKNGYNCNTGGNLNKRHSEETKQKISDSEKGIKNHFYGKRHTIESKNKMSKTKEGTQSGKDNPFYGRTHTKETKEKIRQYNIGKKMNQETKDKIKETLLKNPPNKGKHLTEEQKQHLREINKGKIISVEQRQKISRTLKLKKIYKILDVLNSISQSKETIHI